MDTTIRRASAADLDVLVPLFDAYRVFYAQPSDPVRARDFLAGLPVLGESELYDDICDRLDATNDGERAGAIELALEGLYLARKVSKDAAGGEAVYGG